MSRSISEIPVGKLARTSVAGTAIIKAGGKHLRHAVKRPFLSKSERKRNRERLDDDTAQLAFEAFTQLRGTALKIAQMLSMETNFLPESFRKELSKSYHQVPPLGRPLVRKLMQQEFGNPAEQVFARFDAKAFAAASLGQVHAARNENNDDLAVKLQYPGIRVTIENDMQLVRSLVKRTRHARLLLPSLDEIEARLREEVDYLHEADSTEWFQQNLHLDDVVIPLVYRDLTSKRVLTTSRLAGLHLEQWLQTNPSQASRDHFGQLLYDVFVHSFYKLHALHADPNPGNYLFSDEGKLGLLDFGCVRHWSAEFVDLVSRLLSAYMENNADVVVKIYEKLGMLDEMPQEALQQFYDTTLQPFGAWFSRPFKSDFFDFGNKNSSYTTEGLKEIYKVAHAKKINNLASDFVYLNRTFIGLYQILERMGAIVKMRRGWLL